MSTKALYRFVLSIIFSLLMVSNCFAFGVSPPWVRNYNLLPGSHFEETIILSRSDPDVDLKAKTIYALPEEMEGWVTIDRGDEFTLPKGEMRIPIKVMVNVPTDAKLGRYKGGIKIETVPEKEKVGVGIALAVGIEIDLEVSEREAEGMIVRYLNMENFFEERKPIVLLIRMENTGNIKTRLDKVTAEFYDQYRTELLAKAEDDDLDWVPAFETKEVLAKFPVKLKPGPYWVYVKLYKNGEVVREDRFLFEVTERELPLLLKKLEENKVYVISGLVFIALLFGSWKFFSKKFKIVKVTGPAEKITGDKKKEEPFGLSENQGREKRE